MLIDLYETLCQNLPQEDGAVFGLPLEDRHPLWLSVDSNAWPALLLPAREDDYRPDIVFRSVDALFSRSCEIGTTDPETRSGCYSLVRLKETDPYIVRLFLRILEERFCSDYHPSNNATIATKIQEIAALFSRIDEGGRNLIGLWGELYVISCAQDPVTAVRCWSTYKNSKYDFVSDNFALDVKTTFGASPKHRFSLEQLRPTRDFDVYIGSICVIETHKGKSVGTLMDTLAKEISDLELRNAFLQQCLAKGGRELYRSEKKIRAYPSESALVLYKAQDIPAPEVAKETPIENVRFDVELSAVKPISDKIREEILKF